MPSETKGGPVKRTKATKYSEVAGEEDIDEQTVNEVLGKTKVKGRTRHAFDQIEDNMELSEQ